MGMMFTNVEFCYRYWRRTPLRFLTTVGLLLCHTLLLVIVPVQLESLTNNFTTGDAASSGLVLGIVATFIASAACRLLAIRAWNTMEVHHMGSVAIDCFGAAISRNYGWHVQSRSTSISRLLTLAPWGYHTYGELILFTMLPAVAMAVAVSVIGLMKAPIIGAIFLTGILLYAALSVLLGLKFVLPGRLRAIDAENHLNVTMADALNCFSVIKLTGTEASEIARTKEVSQSYRRALRNSWTLNLLAESAQDGVLVVTKVVVIAGIALLASRGGQDAGLFAYAVTTFFVVESLLRDLARSVQQTARAAADLGELRKFVGDVEYEKLEHKSPAGTAWKHPDIQFRNVTFAYPGKESDPAVKDVSLDIKPGQRVAIIGPSGAGKSTLMKLLIGLYEPTIGRITFNGNELGAIDDSELRGNIGIVPQDPVLFDRSIHENIGHFFTDNREDIVRAAIQANAHDFVSALPSQYDERPGPLGLRLSGGQRQRVAIARALVAQKPIEIFDEATSALDSENERAILDRLLAPSSEKIRIVVTHRHSVLNRVDLIIVMLGGRIVDQGSYEEIAGRYSDTVFRELDDPV